ncbi:hypothetical protein [Achromobacter deleyi]|uniref:hypothetical protein n=1 Tax=Achromobacter deleyi TaxID=1353891 RepID=UPI001490E5A0|nr:hypothetical protein [Achromobacter deleyi]QVQ26165.1 hypothetical protein HLG70_25490 [Achromobacter deleyi]UIP21727.1 hypothetical protein LYZ39_04165 [Achromobacter deleyi]
MKVEAIFRRRALVGEDVAQLNHALVDKLSKIREIFVDQCDDRLAIFDRGTGESASTNLSPCLVQGVCGGVIYASRIQSMVKDRATSDDSLGLEINLEKIDFVRFSSVVFPKIVHAFGPYRAAIVTDPDQELDDYESVVEASRTSNLDINGRDGVFRFQSANYFDNLLCTRAFGMGATDVAARLAGHFDVVKEFDGGVFFLTADRPVRGTESIEIDASVRRILGL